MWNSYLIIGVPISVFLIAWMSARVTKRMIKYHHMNFEKYKKRFFFPPNWMKKLFKLKRELIPRYLIFRLGWIFASFVFCPVLMLIGTLRLASPPFFTIVYLVLLCCWLLVFFVDLVLACIFSSVHCKSLDRYYMPK